LLRQFCVDPKGMAKVVGKYAVNSKTYERR
jgi:hypothetical protein